MLAQTDLQGKIYTWLTVNIKVKEFFCTSSHIIRHTHIAPCVRYLSCQHLMVGKDGKIESIKNADL